MERRRNEKGMREHMSSGAGEIEKGATSDGRGRQQSRKGNDGWEVTLMGMLVESRVREGKDKGMKRWRLTMTLDEGL